MGQALLVEADLAGHGQPAFEDASLNRLGREPDAGDSFGRESQDSFFVVVVVVGCGPCFVTVLVVLVFGMSLPAAPATSRDG